VSFLFASGLDWAVASFFKAFVVSWVRFVPRRSARLLFPRRFGNGTDGVPGGVTVKIDSCSGFGSGLGSVSL
jgi:hypothetical protein